MRLEKFDTTWLKLLLFTLLSAAILYFVYYRVLALLPPPSVTIAAGGEGSAYHDLALRYREILAEDGIEVEILETAGSVENAERLAGPEADADAAFIQGGIPIPEGRDVEALAATFLEPLWVFHRGSLSGPVDPSGWSGLSIAAGIEGGGTWFVIEALSRITGRNRGDNTLLPIGGATAAEALRAGEIDLALFVAPVTAPYLQPLFTDDEIELASIRDSQALSRQLAFVQPAMIPRSGFDYTAELPPDDVELIAMVGRLVARANLHPALVDRLIDAARRVHSRRDLITDENQFPSTQAVAMPVNAQAEDLLKKPPSPLYRFLPYWVVAQVNSFALLLVPLLVVIVPLVRILPGIYEWQMRARVYRRYPELREIEREAGSAATPQEIERLEGRLARIEDEITRLALPLRYREQAYTMRVHINLVRERLRQRRASATARP